MGEHTLAVILATLSDLRSLGEEFESLRGDGYLELQAPPKEYRAGDVLLACTAPRGSGGLYLLVGVLRGAELRDDERSLSFEEAEEFVRPIIVRYQRSNFRRDDLLGNLENWGGSGFYYLPADALEIALAENQAGEALSAL